MREAFAEPALRVVAFTPEDIMSKSRPGLGDNELPIIPIKPGNPNDWEDGDTFG